MATVKYLLKRPQAVSKTAIEVVLIDGRDCYMRIPAGISINPKHWKKSRERVHFVHSADSDCIAHNNLLNGKKGEMGYKENVLDIYLQAKKEGIKLDRADLIERLEPKQVESFNMWQLWDKFLESKKGIFKHHSFVKFGSLKGHLEAFEKKQEMSFNLDTITDITMEDLQTFMYNEQNLNTQSTSKYIGIFKIFLNWCVKRKHTVNSDFRNFIATTQPDTLKVIMSNDDLQLIRLAEIDKGYLQNTQSLFLLACLTGLRYSDFSRINKQHLKKDSEGYTLSIRQQKTEEYIDIPLTPEAADICLKLIDGSVHPISNQNMNTYVKELCKLAGIDEPFEKHIYKGRDKTVQIVPKYELVSTHTGRRTFCTNLLNSGIPAEVVMQFSGHRDYKSFSKYVNIPKKAQMKAVRESLNRSYLKIA